MRVIGGRLKGMRIQAPSHLPVRPTTDMAKEALFNILHNQYQIARSKILDLFAGTGNISIEFASRDAKEITSVDMHTGCIKWLQNLSEKNKLNLHVVKADVFKYLQMQSEIFDFIFADPPYHLNNIPEIVEWVFEKQWLRETGLLIIEHQSLQKLDYLPQFYESRKYGNSTFSFFKHQSAL